MQQWNSAELPLWASTRSKFIFAQVVKRFLCMRRDVLENISSAKCSFSRTFSSCGTFQRSIFGDADQLCQIEKIHFIYRTSCSFFLDWNFQSSESRQFLKGTLCVMVPLYDFGQTWILMRKVNCPETTLQAFVSHSSVSNRKVPQPLPGQEQKSTNTHPLSTHFYHAHTSKLLASFFGWSQELCR